MSATDTNPETPPNAAALRRWLDGKVGAVERDLTWQVIAGGRSNPTYELTDGVRRWVLRRPPFGHVLATAHDMGREFRMLQALHGTDVPVPEPLGHCADPGLIGAEFYVMEHLGGTTPRSREDAAQLTEPQRRRLSENVVDVLIRLHRLDPGSIGLGDLGRPDGYLERQVERWRRQWKASQTAPRPLVDELLDRLAASTPRSRHPGIVHGDFKVDNLMVAPDDPTRIIGVLDWEMATHGETMVDVGYLTALWDEPNEEAHPLSRGTTALTGFLQRDELLTRYAAARGDDVSDLDWYLVLADVKLAVILEGIHARFLQGAATSAQGADVAEMIPVLLARAQARTETSTPGARS